MITILFNEIRIYIKEIQTWAKMANNYTKMLHIIKTR